MAGDDSPQESPSASSRWQGAGQSHACVRCRERHLRCSQTHLGPCAQCQASRVACDWTATPRLELVKPSFPELFVTASQSTDPDRSYREARTGRCYTTPQLVPPHFKPRNSELFAVPLTITSPGQQAASHTVNTEGNNPSGRLGCLISIMHERCPRASEIECDDDTLDAILEALPQRAQTLADLRDLLQSHPELYEPGWLDEDTIEVVHVAPEPLKRR